MMSANLKQFPRKDDLVIGVVSNITKHGVYIRLIEYENLEGYCHISEVAGAWIRNIRNFVRIDQQVVGKVLRADSRKRQVDLSIKRVSTQKRKEKIQEYKQQMSAIAIIRLIADKLGKSEEEVRSIIEPIFIEEFGSLYHGFEYIATEGEFDIANQFPKDLAVAIEEMAKSSIKINTFEVEVKIGLRSFAPDGVEQIRGALMAMNDKLDTYQNIEYELFTVGSPTYRLWVSSKYHEDLDEIVGDMKKIIEEYCSDKPLLEYSIKEEKK